MEVAQYGQSFFPFASRTSKEQGNNRSKRFEDGSEDNSKKGNGLERMSANKSPTTDRSHGAQVQARTGNQQGGYCCMNLMIYVLHLPCTIGKKEDISTGIAWQKGVLELVGESI